ncbi:MAG TPA: PKD domain-containing protein [Pyrinomonadaceae bacterium]|nr:PKD domain-containing protein [Pyrinomonadaceae bacterium]
MTQQIRFAQCTGVRRLVSRYSVLLVALILSVSLLSSVPVAALDSELDPSFGGGGGVIADHNEFDQITDILIQPDGKIVATGHSGIFATDAERLDMMVARYNVDGSPDFTFGNNGVITTDVLFDARAMAVALQEDGKIVVAGSGAASFSSRFAVVRYNADGSLDTSFGFGGIVTERIGRLSRIMDVAIQSDGYIVVAGEANFSSRDTSSTATLARFEPSGFLDFTFGVGGVSRPVPAGFTTSPMATHNSIALQPDQKIAVAGVCRLNTRLEFCLSRYNSDGSLDNTFDGDGLVLTSFNSFSSDGVAKDLSLQLDGKLVAVGQSVEAFSSPVSVLARFNPDGSLDNSFGSNGDGKVIIFEVAQLRAESLALKPNGRIVVAGGAVFFGGRSEMTVTYFSPDGVIQDLATTSVGEHAVATAVAVQPDGRIVVGGYGNFFTDPAPNPSDGLQHTFSDSVLLRYGTNNPPIVSITSPASGSIFAVNTPVDFTGMIVDNPEDTHTAEWFFDSIIQPGIVPVPGFVSTTHTFTEPGLYKVSLKVTDDDLLTGTATTVDGLEGLVVIYDPSGGWVAGGGWIDSPAGAYAVMPESTGKANFGFVSKYQNGASAPTGNVEFQFNAAGLKFQSKSFQWLVISGGRKAQYKGVGTINGLGDYQFMLTAIDGDQPGGGGQDKFRIKIWRDDDFLLIYDNQLNAPDGDDPTTVLGGGSIVIHQ